MATYLQYARSRFEEAGIDVESNMAWIEEHLEEYAHDEYEDAHPAIQEVLNTIINNLIDREREKCLT